MRAVRRRVRRHGGSPAAGFPHDHLRSHGRRAAVASEARSGPGSAECGVPATLSGRSALSVADVDRRKVVTIPTLSALSPNTGMLFTSPKPGSAQPGCRIWHDRGVHPSTPSETGRGSWGGAGRPEPSGAYPPPGRPGHGAPRSRTSPPCATTTNRSTTTSTRSRRCRSAGRSRWPWPASPRCSAAAWSSALRLRPVRPAPLDADDLRGPGALRAGLDDGGPAAGDVADRRCRPGRRGRRRLRRRHLRGRRPSPRSATSPWAASPPPSSPSWPGAPTAVRSPSRSAAPW